VLLAAASCAAADPVRVVGTQRVPDAELPAAPGASHRLHLSLYAFAGSRWRTEEIIAAVLASARVLAQCGIAVAGIELSVLDAPRQFRFYSTPVSRQLLRVLAVARPAIFFVDETLNRPAFDAEAIGLGNSATRPELANTVWVAYGAHDLALALAHELAHVLADSGEHSSEPGNLMRDETAPDNTRLGRGQCERMRVRGEANRLLQRSAASETTGANGAVH